MKSRLLVAAIGVPFVVLVIVWLPKLVLAILMAVMCAIAVYELLHATRLLTHARILLYTAVLAALVPIWSYFGSPIPAAVLALAIYCILLFAELLPAYRTLKVESLSTGLLAGIRAGSMSVYRWQWRLSQTAAPILRAGPSASTS